MDIWQYYHTGKGGGLTEIRASTLPRAPRAAGVRYSQSGADPSKHNDGADVCPLYPLSYSLYRKYTEK
jgi:hypothetical protein